MNLKPQKNNYRIQELDALRGFALFGILLVNIFVFHAPYCYYGEFYGTFEANQGLIIEGMISLAGGKFMFIFSFLFGYGIYMQLASRKNRFNGYFTKRMLILGLIGALHILLFWIGDILLSYAILGLLILPFINLSNRLILLLGFLFIFFRPIYYFGVVLIDLPLINHDKPASLDQFISIFQSGSYFEILKLRIPEFLAFLPENLVWYIPKSFGLFFIGFYAARKSLFERLRIKRIQYCILAIILFILSLVWILIKEDFFFSFNLEEEPIWRPILIFFNVLFESTQGLSYIFGFSIIFQSTNWISSILAKTGRLALSNYMLQSLICVIVFYGFGFGFYVKLRPSELIILAVFIYLINLVFSFIYLRFWQTGPLEYLWKSRLK